MSILWRMSKELQRFTLASLLLLLLAPSMVYTVVYGQEYLTPGEEPGIGEPGGPTEEVPPPPLDELCDIPGPPPSPHTPIICGGDGPIGLSNDAAVKAYHQDGTLVDSDNPATLGEDIDCVAGIDWAAVPLPGNLVEMVCYILPPGSDPNDYEAYALAKQASSTEIACPPELATMDQCFSVVWDGSYFDQVGDWYFVAVFYLNNDVVDLAGDDFRVYSFMVVPEFLIGGIAAVGSTMAMLILYKGRSRGAKN